MHDEEVLGKAYDGRLMKRLLVYTKPYRWVVALAVTMLVMAALFQTALAFITKSGIDDYILTGTAENFEIIGLKYLALIFGIMIVSFFQIYSTMWLGQKVQDDIRMEVFAHLQKLHLGYYDKNPVGR